MPATVSSNSRLQALRPVTSFSCSSFSSSSDSWCGRNTRRSRSQGCQLRQRRVRQLLLQHRIVQPVQLQREEQQVAADRGHPLAHRLVEAADHRRWWNRRRTAAGHRTSAARALPRSARIRRSPRPARRPDIAASLPCMRRRERARGLLRRWRSPPRRPGCRAPGRGRTDPRPAGSIASGWLTAASAGAVMAHHCVLARLRFVIHVR